MLYFEPYFIYCKIYTTSRMIVIGIPGEQKGEFFVILFEMIY